MITGYPNKMNLSWKFCVGICTDGAHCMVGCINGFASLTQKEIQILFVLIAFHIEKF